MTKKIIAFSFLIFASAQLPAQNKISTEQYIEKYKNLAEAEMLRTGVPAAITLAQGILESGSGQSELALHSNNHFGIKCKAEWTGDTYYHDDDERNECFRSYPTPEDSYRDHSDFLKNRQNYQSLFKLSVTDYKSWAYGLKRAGYATEKNYPQMLIKVIEDNNLQQYTFAALQKENADEAQYASQDDNAADANENAALTVSNTVAFPAQTQAEPALQTAAIYPENVFTINQTKVVYAKAGTSLFALASNHDISYGKLLEFNELKNVDVLQQDQLIFLAKKPKRGAKNIHVVQSGETIESIAQMEGVQLQSLFEYNKMNKGMQPKTGEKIYLRDAHPIAPKLARS